MDSAIYIIDSDGYLRVFSVEHNDNGQWLNSNYGNTENVWNADEQWLFVRRNSLYSPLFKRSFLLFVFAIRRLFFLFHQADPKAKYIF